MDNISAIQRQLNLCVIRDTYLLLQQSRFGDAARMENGKIMREKRQIFQLVNVGEKVLTYCLLFIPFFPAVDCGKPDDPLYGYHKKLSNYKFEAEVEYSCYYGYKLQGKERAVCQSTGNWDSPPTCECTKSISRHVD